jgi:Uma2 family endonuclease
VRIDRHTSFEPDALVYCGPRLPDDAVEVPEPVLVVEILPPSTAHRDIGAKLAGYFRLPSVRHYLIVDPDRRLLIHQARGEGDLLATRIVSEGPLVLRPPGIELDMGELFATA